MPMLESLHLKNVGPAPELRFEPAERLNLITGDNGLGKSFLLDVAWWARPTIGSGLAG
jgi:predicted ATPase